MSRQSLRHLFFTLWRTWQRFSGDFLRTGVVRNAMAGESGRDRLIPCGRGLLSPAFAQNDPCGDCGIQ